MTVLVQNCFHWVGFHIVNQLLEDGYTVKGIDFSTEQASDHLSMFFARHASFSLIEPNVDESFNVSIVINSPQYADNIDATHHIVIDETNRQLIEHVNSTYIKQPLLFGKWMPIRDKGVFYCNNHIAFDSEAFLENAIYINDFTKMISQLLKKRDIPTFLDVQYDKIEESPTLILDNTVYIRDNTPIERKIEEVLTHYKQFEKYYY